MSRTRADKIKTADVRAALKRVYCAPRWALMFEVSNATGYGASRYADAVAMSLWPSQGLELHGMEIKVSRSDWAREKANPTKAEEIAAYCDRWWLVTAEGVVLDETEIPPAWGWMEFDGKGFKTRRKAGQTAAKAMDRKFLAALLRRADQADTAMIEAEIAKRTADIEGALNDRIEREVAMRTSRYQSLKKAVADFEEASGIKISERDWRRGPEDVGRAVRAVLDSGVASTFDGLARQAKVLRDAADRIEGALNGVGDERRGGHAA